MDENELIELSVKEMDRLRDAVEKGDKDTALELIDRIKNNRIALVNLYVEWVDLLLTVIGKRLGDEAVYESMIEFGNRVYRAWLRPLNELSIEDLVRSRAYSWSAVHPYADFNIKEDEEKFIFTIECDTFGPLLKKRVYGKPKKARPWTYGREDVSYYCTHTPVCVEIQNIEEFGYPLYVVFPPKKPGDSCVWWFYKDRKAIPEEYYKRVGKEKKV